MSHLRITQAGLVSLVAFIVGQLAAFIPSIAASQEVLISAGSTAVVLGFLIANAIHALASAKGSLPAPVVARAVPVVPVAAAPPAQPPAGAPTPLQQPL